MQLDLLLLGPPGAGKGTQAKRVSVDRGIPQIATGDMLREAMAAGTELGLRVRPIYDRGDLVPDELMVALIRDRLGAPDTAGGFVLDGFPRTMPQAEALDSMLVELDRRLCCVLEFQLDRDEAVRRMMSRAEQEQRSDDTPETIRHRLEVHAREAEQLTAYYLARGVLVGIDAQGSVDEVYAEVENVLAQVEQRAAT
jgi:adenylate kinase